jgi:HEPN domain-containing protein
MSSTGKMVVRPTGHTPLSDFSADADTWLQWADQTHVASKVLFEHCNPFLWFAAAQLGHQALETYLKAALIRRGRRIANNDVWGHDLIELASELESKGTKFDLGFLDDLQKFNDLFRELRYPAPAVKILDLSMLEGELLDALVLTLRPLAILARTNVSIQASAVGG